ncbi:DegT/DnrJ/EryC1/StrS family aminotransferase [Candidatus Woesearchaeota archaeon]|nr:DegT/DnrJ/EryC1/StrS family aminotransferase [Candidatus Woesearchaeota archaeon]
MKKREKFLDFSPPAITDKEINAVVETLKSGWLSMGPRVFEFEKKFSEYIGCRCSVAVNSCTSALFLSLAISGINKGDEVITTPFTFASTANVICHLGAKPVFCDIDKDTFNISPKQIESKITKKTKAILPVHYGGQPCDMEEIQRIADEHGLVVVEDAAHALGAELNNKRIGASGNLTCFSFYPTKNITTGEGGMITTNNKEIADRLKLLRLHGISSEAWSRYSRGGKWKYDVLAPGYKLNMSDMNAAVGIVQLERIKELNQKREEIYNLYTRKLSLLNAIELQKPRENIKSSYHLFPILLKNHNRDSFIDGMTEMNIGTSVHFIPLHLQPFYQKEFGYKEGDFPVAEDIYGRIISLPIHPMMTDGDAEYVCEAIMHILG